MNLIEQLKDPKQAQPFGLRTPEEQEALKKAGKENCRWLSRSGNWIYEEEHKNFPFCIIITYILQSDYQPKPEYVDFEIELDDGFYGARSYTCNYKGVLLPFTFTHLHCLPSLPEFDHFFLEGGQIQHLEHIAESIHNGAKVYARFRKRREL